jgi:hypothetical protein
MCTCEPRCHVGPHTRARQLMFAAVQSVDVTARSTYRRFTGGHCCNPSKEQSQMRGLECTPLNSALSPYSDGTCFDFRPGSQPPSSASIRQLPLPSKSLSIHHPFVLTPFRCIQSGYRRRNIDFSFREPSCATCLAYLSPDSSHELRSSSTRTVPCPFSGGLCQHVYCCRGQ